MGTSSRNDMGFLPNSFTSILQQFSILVNGKLAETKWAFSPDLFTSTL